MIWNDYDQTTIINVLEYTVNGRGGGLGQIDESCLHKRWSIELNFVNVSSVHGAAPWNMDYQRRLILYRFAPSFIGYGRAYTNDAAPRWPASYYEVCVFVYVLCVWERDMYIGHVSGEASGLELLHLHRTICIHVNIYHIHIHKCVYLQIYLYTWGLSVEKLELPNSVRLERPVCIHVNV